MKPTELNVTPELIKSTKKLSTEEKRKLLLEEQARFDALSPEDKELEKLKAQKARLDAIELNRRAKERIKDGPRNGRRQYLKMTGHTIDGKMKFSDQIKKLLK